MQDNTIATILQNMPGNDIGLFNLGQVDLSPMYGWHCNGSSCDSALSPSLGTQPSQVRSARELLAVLPSHPTTVYFVDLSEGAARAPLNSCRTLYAYLFIASSHLQR